METPLQEEQSVAQTPEPELKPQTKPKPKRTLLILGIIGAVVVLGGIVATVKITNRRKSDQDQASQQAQQQAQNQQQGQPGQPPINDAQTQHLAAVDATLPSCPATPLFSQLPIAQDHIDAVSPLGNINPNGHVTPSDHIGIGLTVVPGQNVDRSSGKNPVTIAADLRAPTDITIYKIHAQTITENGGTPNADYSFFYKPCKEATFYFNHVPVVSDVIKAQMDAVKSSAHCQSQKENAATLDEFCDYSLTYKAPAGTIIGTAGGPNEASTGIDFGGWDLRTKPLAYLDTNLSKSVRADELLHSICPIDYYPTTLQTYMYSVVGRSGERRTAQPLCGEIMLDKAGTLSGNWYVQGSNLDTWESNFSMSQDTVKPSIGIVSVGGVIGTPAAVEYTKQATGTVNLDPTKTQPGTMYCYSSDLIVSDTAPRTRYLFQLAADGQSMQVEEQSGTCTGSLSFSKATTYTRLAN